MNNLSHLVSRSWIGIAKSNAGRVRGTTLTQTATFKRYSLVPVVAVSGAATLWLFSSQTTVHAEAPHYTSIKHYARDHAHSHTHGYDKRLVLHTAPVTPSKPVAHENRAYMADIDTKLEHESLDLARHPVEEAVLTSAPNVPPSITRDYPVVLKVDLTRTIKKTQLTGTYKYEQ